MSPTAFPILRWYVLEWGGGRYEVLAAGREAAIYYLRKVLAEPRPYEPGHAIRVLEPPPAGGVARQRRRRHDASPIRPVNEEA